MNNEPMKTIEELSAELDRLRAGLTQSPANTSSPLQFPANASSPLQNQFPANAGSMLRPVGLLVSISIPTPNGDVPCYLQLGPEAAANPQGAIQQLMQAGWPVKCWAPRQQNGGGGWGGGGGRGWGRRY